MKHIARVTWVPAGQGGRSRPPDTTRYVTMARFDEDGQSWPDGGWSVIVEFNSPPGIHDDTSMGTVSFLMENAPQERLRQGARFALYEGLKKVAEVNLV